MYLAKEYQEYDRQIHKYVNKTSWFQLKGEERKWRSELKGTWKGAQPLQRKVKGMDFTTILQVPSTKNSELLARLSKREPKVAKLTKYNVKIVEKSGIQLARLFDRQTNPERCNWNNCRVCDIGGSKCKQQNECKRK